MYVITSDLSISSRGMLSLSLRFELVNGCYLNCGAFLFLFIRHEKVDQCYFSFVSSTRVSFLRRYNCIVSIWKTVFSEADELGVWFDVMKILAILFVSGLFIHPEHCKHLTPVLPFR